MNEIGLNMYLSECRRWVKNGEHLLKASAHDLEKVTVLFQPAYEILAVSSIMKSSYSLPTSGIYW